MLAPFSRFDKFYVLEIFWPVLFLRRMMIFEGRRESSSNHALSGRQEVSIFSITDNLTKGLSLELSLLRFCVS